MSELTTTNRRTTTGIAAVREALRGREIESETEESK